MHKVSSTTKRNKGCGEDYYWPSGVEKGVVTCVFLPYSEDCKHLEKPTNKL
jgi:hypothetical protein